MNRFFLPIRCGKTTKKTVFSFGLFLLAAIDVYGQGVHVQTTAKSCGSVASCSIALPKVSKAGDLITVGFDWNTPSVSAVSVNDSAGNSYSSPTGPTTWQAGAWKAQAFFAKSINALTTPLTVKVQLSGASTKIEVYVSEYSPSVAGNILDADSKAVAAGSGIAMDSGPISTTAAHDLLWCYGVSETSVVAAGSGFATRSSFHDNIIEDILDVPAAGAIDCRVTNSNSFWVIAGLAFKSIPAGSSVPPPVTATMQVLYDDGTSVQGTATLLLEGTPETMLDQKQLDPTGTVSTTAKLDPTLSYRLALVGTNGLEIKEQVSLPLPATVASTVLSILAKNKLVITLSRLDNSVKGSPVWVPLP